MIGSGFPKNDGKEEETQTADLDAELSFEQFGRLGYRISRSVPAAVVATTTPEFV
jgi:hypothetical protein